MGLGFGVKPHFFKKSELIGLGGFTRCKLLESAQLHNNVKMQIHECKVLKT